MTETLKLRVLCWDHPRCTSPVRAAASEWQSARPHVQFRVMARPLAAFNDQPLSEIAASADLIFIDHPMVGGVADSGALLPLNDLLSDELLRGLATDSVGDSHASYTWNEQQWAIAVDAACQVAVLDPTRFPEVLGETPKTWDDVLQCARRVRGAVAIPLYPSDAVLSLVSITANLRTNGSREDAFWSTDALEIMRELARWVDPTCYELNPPKMLDHMSTASADVAPVYIPLSFGYTNYQRPTATGRRLSFVDVPSVGPTPSGAVLGGAGLAVSASSAHPQEAARFAAWLAAPEAQRTAVLLHEGQPGSRAVWQDPVADQVVGGFFSGTIETIESSHVRPRDPWWPGYQEAAGRLLVELLRENASASSIHRDLSRLLDKARRKESS